MKIYKNEIEFKEDFKKNSIGKFILLNDGVTPKSLKANEIIDFLDRFYELMYTVEYLGKSIKYNWYYRNPQSYLYKELTFDDIKGIIKLIVHFTKIKNYNLKNLAFDCFDELSASNMYNLLNAKQYNKPPQNYILTKNGIFNISTKEFYSLNSSKYIEYVTEYHFFDNAIINYHKKPYNISKFNLYETYINNLTNDDSEIRLLIEQILFSILIGDGKHKYFMISGDPGIGKSILGYIMSALAGSINTEILNLDKLDNPNAINKLSLQTKLIIGDDLKNNAKISNDAITNYKILVDGNALSVEVKYEPNRIIRTNAVWIQMMNEPPKIYEAGEAITDRTIFIHLKGKNHRNSTSATEKEIGKRLDTYLGKKQLPINYEFIDEIGSYILNNIDSFDSYTIPESIIKATANMVNENNWMHQFIEHGNMIGLFEFNQLKQSTITSCVKLFLKENNPGMTLPSSKTIIKEWNKACSDLDYELSNKRLRNLNLLNFNTSIVQNYMFDQFDDNNNNQSYIYQKIKPTITKDNVEKFKKKINANIATKNLQLSIRELIMLDYLIDNGDLTAISLKNDLSI